MQCLPQFIIQLYIVIKFHIEIEFWFGFQDNQRIVSLKPMSVVHWFLIFIDFFDNKRQLNINLSIIRLW